MILALNCANFSTSMVLWHEGKTLSSFKGSSVHGESATLISSIDQLFKTAQIALSSLESIAVTTGPGSFTGIRLGLAAAKGLSLALQVPIFSVNSFNWVAESYKASFDTLNPLAVTLESKREEIFVAFFSQELNLLQKPTFLSPDDIILRMKDKTFDIIGNGAVHLMSHKGLMCRPWMPEADDLAFYAHKYKKMPEKFDPCVPFYIRPPEIHGKS